MGNGQWGGAQTPHTRYPILPPVASIPRIIYLHSMVKALKQYLSRFAEFDEKDLQLLSRLGETRSFDKKVRLVNEGEADQYLNLVIKGLIRKYVVRGDEEIITQLAMEGQLVSSSVSFLSGEPSCYIVETIEPTLLYSISRDQIEYLYTLGSKWEHIGRMIMTDLYLQKEKRDLERVCYSIRERFLRFVDQHPELLIRVPQKYLASYLQIQPETFSRLKHLLQTVR